MRKTLFRAFILFSLILMVFTSCDHNVYMGELVHKHWYYVQYDGAWQCKCGHVLEGTEKPYITYIRNSQPTEVLDLTAEPPLDLVVGAGKFTLNDLGTEMVYSNTGSKSQEVYLRTDSAGTDLTINAAPDVMHHYGTIGIVTIEAIAGSSYHERGKAAFAQIQNGRMVLESGSDVRQVHLKRTGTEEYGEFNNITISKAETVSLPKLTRDPIHVSEEGTLVVALQTGTAIETEKQYYWLTAVGVFEQVVVSDNKETAETTTEQTVYASESENNEQVLTAHYIANTFTSSSGGEDVKVSAKPVATDEKGAVTEWSYVVTGAISGEEKPEYEAIKNDSDNTVIIENSSIAEPVETKITNGTKEDELETERSKAKESAVAFEIAEEQERELTHVDALDPTCTADGYSAYDYYMDGEERVEIGKVILPALGHTLSWTYDEDGHWQRCAKCGHETVHEEHDLTILFKPGTGENTVVTEIACNHSSCAFIHTNEDYPSSTGAFSLTHSSNGVIARRTGESTWTLSVSDEIKDTYAGGSCKWFNSDCSEQLPNTSTDFNDSIEVTVVVDGSADWVRVYCLYYDSENNLAGGGYVDICK